MPPPTSPGPPQLPSGLRPVAGSTRAGVRATDLRRGAQHDGAPDDGPHPLARGASTPAVGRDLARGGDRNAARPPRDHWATARARRELAACRPRRAPASSVRPRRVIWRSRRLCATQEVAVNSVAGEPRRSLSRPCSAAATEPSKATPRTRYSWLPPRGEHSRPTFSWHTRATLRVSWSSAVAR